MQRSFETRRHLHCGKRGEKEKEMLRLDDDCGGESDHHEDDQDDDDDDGIIQTGYQSVSPTSSCRLFLSLFLL